jgi:phytanoyl-CoA hydroxylase
LWKESYGDIDRLAVSGFWGPLRRKILGLRMESPNAKPLFSSRPASSLTAEQVEAFNRDGFLVLPGYLSPDEVEKLKEAYNRVVDTFDPTAHRSVFETGKGERDEHFLRSGDKVTYFLEPSAERDAEGKLVRPFKESINKVGHALHDQVPEFRNVVLSEKTAGICSSLGFEHVAVPQSMVIVKPKHIGTPVHPHVDFTFLYDTTRSHPEFLLGFWTPFDKTTTSNGCLWGVPGSHKRPVEKFFRRTPDGKSTEMIGETAKPFDTTGALPLEMNPGDMLLIHGAVVHFSEENKSDKGRMAFTWHLIESGKGLEWSKENWLQREDGQPFPQLY